MVAAFSAIPDFHYAYTQFEKNLHVYILVIRLPNQKNKPER